MRRVLIDKVRLIAALEDEIRFEEYAAEYERCGVDLLLFCPFVALQKVFFVLLEGVFLLFLRGGARRRERRAHFEGVGLLLFEGADALTAVKFGDLECELLLRLLHAHARGGLCGLGRLCGQNRLRGRSLESGRG